jgi:hypothetical protein
MRTVSTNSVSFSAADEQGTTVVFVPPRSVLGRCGCFHGTGPTELRTELSHELAGATRASLIVDASHLFVRTLHFCHHRNLCDLCFPISAKKNDTAPSNNDSANNEQQRPTTNNNKQNIMQHRRHLLIVAPLILLLLLAVWCGDAFIVDSSSRRLTPLIVRSRRGDGSYATHLFMFDNEKSAPPAPPLETIDTLSSSTTTTDQQPMNLVKDKNTGKVVEVKWVDPAMSANENPFNMGWYVRPNHHEWLEKLKSHRMT